MDDVLKVRNYPERTLVDLTDDERSERFLVFDMDGAMIHMGVERVRLDWRAVTQLRKLMMTAEKMWSPT